MESNLQSAPRIDLGGILGRGLRRRCPQCDRASIFDERKRLRVDCPECGLVFERRGGDTFFFLYVGAGAITFAFIVVMYVFRIWSYGWAVRGPYLAAGIAAMIGLMSFRMGFAVSLDYLTRLLFEGPEALEPRGGAESSAEGGDDEGSRPAPAGRPPEG
jgi:uncharacterized protein (DUF983 family)